jgi:ketosteroid isomerase-like protein
MNQGTMEISKTIKRKRKRFLNVKKQLMDKINCAVLIVLVSVIFSANCFSQGPEAKAPSLQRARIIVDSLDTQFSQYYYRGDLLALYAMYTKDAILGSSRGEAILRQLGSMIRSSIKDNARQIKFTTTSLSVDGEFIIEVGVGESKDDNGASKGKFKYLVVWKQENGIWKLYRDMGL